MKEDKKMKNYLNAIDINNPHNRNSPVASLDTDLRECIKELTNIDEISISALGHSAIINRELQGQICRICLRGLELICNGKKAICNDYLFLRHPQCINPICSDCWKTKPDVFYKAYRKGWELYQKKQDLFFKYLTK